MQDFQKQNMPKNILLIENLGSDFYKSRLKYAKYLVSQGWKVSVLVPLDEYTEKIKSEEIKVYSYFSEERQNLILKIFYIFKACKQIFSKDDIKIIHSFRLFPNFINVFANLFSNRKVIVHITGLGVAYANKNFSYLILRWISNVVYWFIITFANLVIVQNEDDKRQLSKIGLTKNKIILVKGSGVDTDLFSFDSVNREIFRNKYKIRLDEMLFICVTRLLWEKGIREMTIAFQELHEDYPELKLMVVGAPFKDNPRHVSTKYIENFNKEDYIIFTGKQDDIPKLLSSADVFLYPSYYREGIPRALLEALSIGLPIITTKMPGCDQTVIENSNGLLIIPQSSIAIKDAVINLLNQKKNLKKMGIASRRLAIDTFSEEKIYSQIVSVYDK